MPTLLTLNGFKFFFYSNEHEPKHIHIMKNDEFAKVNLENLEVLYNSFKSKDLAFVLDAIKTHKSEFERKWNEYFA